MVLILGIIPPVFVWGCLIGVIDTIKEYGGRGVNFCCTSCRLEGESGSNVLQSGIVVNGSRGLVVGVRDCKEFARCSGYPDKRYETYDGDYWSVK